VGDHSPENPCLVCGDDPLSWQEFGCSKQLVPSKLQSGNPGPPGVAGLPNGHIVAWVSKEPDQDRVLAKVFSSVPGEPLTGELPVHWQDYNDLTCATVASWEDGSSVVVWDEWSEMLGYGYLRYRVIGPSVTLDSDVEGMATYIAAAPLGAGCPVIDTVEGGYVVSAFTRCLTTPSTDCTIHASLHQLEEEVGKVLNAFTGSVDSSSRTTVKALNNSEFVVAWNRKTFEEGESIVEFHKFKIPIVGFSEPVTIAISTDEVYGGPAVLGLDEDSFIVAFGAEAAQGSELRFVTVSPDGLPGEMQVVAQIGDATRIPALVNSGNKFSISWFHGVDEFAQVWTRVYSDDGTPSIPAVQLDPTGISSGLTASLSGEDKFVVVWHQEVNPLDQVFATLVKW